MTDSNIVDLLDRLELEMPAMPDAWAALRAMYDDCMRQPQALRRSVEGSRYGELQGRPALVADIRRELALIADTLDTGPLPLYSSDRGDTGAQVSPIPDGGGLASRLAILKAYDNLGAAD